MSLLERINGVRLTIVGDVMLDRFWWGDVTRISPEAPVPVVSMRQTSLAAGGAANVAANAAGLGARPCLIGVIGRDADAEDLLAQIRAAGISTADVLQTDDRPTTVKTRVIAHNQQVVRVDKETSAALSADLESAIIERCERACAECDAVILSDYAKGVLTDRVISTVVQIARRRKIPVLVDPKGKDFSKYKNAAILTPNRREAAEACGLDDARGIAQIAGARLITALGLDAILVTEGSDGMTLLQNGRDAVHFSAAAREVYDVTGAGDTVTATLAAALAAGADLPAAARLANAAAAFVVEKIGTTVVTTGSLRQYLEDHSAGDERG